VSGKPQLSPAYGVVAAYQDAADEVAANRKYLENSLARLREAESALWGFLGRFPQGVTAGDVTYRRNGSDVEAVAAPVNVWAIGDEDALAAASGVVPAEAAVEGGAL
jgi:hypothetical protein